MIKILAIGNSFSSDTTAYLHAIAESAGVETKVGNLYIGGCPLVKHWENIESGAEAYAYLENGEPTGRMVSINNMLAEDDWDFVTLQQASYHSGMPETFYPYITQVSGFVREKCPRAEQMINETWAYDTDSKHAHFPNYQKSQPAMYHLLKNAYSEAAKKLGLRVIPVGDVIQELRKSPLFQKEHVGYSLTRDGFHLSLTYGRYAAAATWFEKLTGVSVYEAPFTPQGAEIYKINVIKKCVRKIISEYPEPILEA